MNSKSVKTFTATIYVGRLNMATVSLVPERTVCRACEQYVDRIGLCVSVTPTEFIYTDGGEPGFAIGIINYPRFPDTDSNLKARAIEIAVRLMDVCSQNRVSIIMQDETVMLSKES